MNGVGPSGLTLDISKAQIMWMDIEWLGVGSVRTGFIIDGKVIHCHTFNHANLTDSTYITSACLPLRYEMKNLSATASGSTMRQICSSVISEGGYELRGEQRTIGTEITSAKSLTVAGTFYPLVSLRLKTSGDRMDSVVILSAASVLPVSNGNYKWEIVKNGSTEGGTWISAGADSSVEYNISGTTFSGGTVLATGFVSSTNQSAGSINLSKDDLFKFQLERDRYSNTPYEMTLALTCNNATVTAYGSFDWEEVTR
jgi:hypothetical protein